MQAMEWVGSGRLMLCTALEYQLLNVATGTPTPLFTLPVRCCCTAPAAPLVPPTAAFAPSSDRDPCRRVAAARHADSGRDPAPWRGMIAWPAQTGWAVACRVWWAEEAQMRPAGAVTAAIHDRAAVGNGGARAPAHGERKCLLHRQHASVWSWPPVITGHLALMW